MSVATPLAVAASSRSDAPAGALWVNRMARHVFDGDSPDAANPALREFLADLVAPYGLPLRHDLLDQARGQSYGEMAEEVVAGMLSDATPLDLLILTYAMPDVIPGRSTATYLSHLWPGDARAFAICDQGSAAPFTALAVAASCLRAGQRALILVLEQAALHYPGGAAVLPRRHVAVAMLVGDTGEVRVGPGPRQHAGVASDRSAAVLAAELDLMGASGSDVTLLLGAALAARAGHLSLSCAARAVPDGQPVTGVWSELADLVGSAGPAGGSPAAGRMILADYDPELEYLCLLPVWIPDAKAVYYG